MNIQAVITQETAKISCNFEQVKEAIEGRLAKYEGATFTEESKVFAKKEVASLRAEKKSFQDNLRAEKDRYMQPWKEFEAQAKELISLYDKPIDYINGRVQAFEAKRIEEKKQLISKLYFETVSDDVKEFLSLEKIYNPKWENATTREKAIRQEMMEVSISTKSAIETIKAMNSESVGKALVIYKQELSLTSAISYINNYERQKQEILEKEQERKRREEEERIRREEREKTLAEQRAQEEREEVLKKTEEEKAAAVEQAREEAAQEVINNLIPDSSGEEQYVYEYLISLSASEKEKLEMYMDSVGIEWRVTE